MSLRYPQLVYLSEFSDGKSVYTEEPLPYQFEPDPSPEGDDIAVEVPNEVHTRQFRQVGNADW